MRTIRRGVLATAVLLTAGMARAGFEYHFYNITNNGSPDVGQQLTMEVFSTQEGFVTFKFWNPVGTACSITDIYFYDGTLLDFAEDAIDQSEGVDFGLDAHPGHLPGYDKLGVAFSVDSEGPGPANGIDVTGEWLAATFELLQDDEGNYLTIDDTLAALADGTLRVGLHVQAFTDGGSDSYLNVVPAPAAAVLGLLGVGLVGSIKRRVS